MEDEIEISHTNLGTPNKNEVTITKGNRGVNLYFSYRTLVAVDNVVSQNEWSRTTGKLLNELNPDKKARVPHAEVLAVAQKRLKEVLG
jgi:hypothetical protein